MSFIRHPSKAQICIFQWGENVFWAAHPKSWIILCLIRVNPFLGIIIQGVCSARDQL